MSNNSVDFQSIQIKFLRDNLDVIDSNQDWSRLREKILGQLGAYLLSYEVKIQLVVLIGILRGIFRQTLFYQIVFKIKNEEE